MPAEAVPVIIGIIAVFAAFSVVLAWQSIASK